MKNITCLAARDTLLLIAAGQKAEHWIHGLLDSEPLGSLKWQLIPEVFVVHSSLPVPVGTQSTAAALH